MIPSRVFVATSNAGKLREMTPMAEEYLARFGPAEGFRTENRRPPLEEETGVTFMENAVLKAASLADALVSEGVEDFAILSDDSGLAVDALRGAPGLFSARYAGDHVAPELHMQKLLRELDAVTQKLEDRTARYHCALALIVQRGGSRYLYEGEGTCEGLIALAPTGASGFGYDPIFWVPDLKASFGELSYEVKNARSHRRRAFEMLALDLGQRGV